ncbi:MAG: hypothetical protein L6R42_010034, partial [Xanthoria sp. 1 TBL-2021]
CRTHQYRAHQFNHSQLQIAQLPQKRPPSKQQLLILFPQEAVTDIDPDPGQGTAVVAAMSASQTKKPAYEQIPRLL